MQPPKLLLALNVTPSAEAVRLEIYELSSGGIQVLVNDLPRGHKCGNPPIHVICPSVDSIKKLMEAPEEALGYRITPLEGSHNES